VHTADQNPRKIIAFLAEAVVDLAASTTARSESPAR
jgi:hypothetical protein